MTESIKNKTDQEIKDIFPDQETVEVNGKSYVFNSPKATIAQKMSRDFGWLTAVNNNMAAHRQQIISKESSTDPEEQKSKLKDLDNSYASEISVVYENLTAIYLKECLVDCNLDKMSFIDYAALNLSVQSKVESLISIWFGTKGNSEITEIVDAEGKPKNSKD